MLKRHPLYHYRRKAFSLIELMIVIMIMGVIYTLSVSGFQKIEEQEEALTLENLKDYLMQFPHEKSVELMCLDNCTECNIYVDGEKVEELQGRFDGFLDSSVKVYRYEYNVGAVEVPQKIYFNKEGVEESICFSYSVDNKKVGDQVFIEYKGFVYDLAPYISPAKRYRTMDKAVEEREKLQQEVIR